MFVRIVSMIWSLFLYFNCEGFNENILYKMEIEKKTFKPCNDYQGIEVA